jgi:hypothetical protein
MRHPSSPKLVVRLLIAVLTAAAYKERHKVERPMGKALMSVFLLLSFLIVMPARPAFAQYRVLSAWPSGLGESFTRVSPSDRPVCEIVAKVLASPRPSGPLSCSSPFYRSAALERPRWSYIDRSKLLPLAHRPPVPM